MSSLQPDSISVFGLGKLGSPLAVALAHKGFNVIGVDVSGQVVEKLNQGVAPVQESGLQEMLAASRQRLRATTDYKDAVLNSQVSCIIVPTPTGPSGTFVLDYVSAAIEKIGQVLANKDDYHLVAIVSTVMPGDTDTLRTSLESVSGKTCGLHFGLCYSPEFIALGSVLKNLLHPDMLLIGQSDDRAGEFYEKVLLQLTDNKPPVRRMNFVNAELTKLAVNSYITVKISYANMLARLCERLPGADAQTVTAALGLDSRIGSKYLTGAMAYGGPCFPRDNIALAKVAEQVGASAPLAVTAHTFNQGQTRSLVEMIREAVPPGAQVTILGLSYKPDTPVIEESASLYLIPALIEHGYEITAYDPMAMSAAQQELGSTRVRWANSLDEAAQTADLVVIATAWPSFKSLNPETLRRLDKKVLVIDCWRILDKALYEEVAQILQLGTHWQRRLTAPT